MDSLVGDSGGLKKIGDLVYFAGIHVKGYSGIGAIATEMEKIGGRMVL